MISASGPFRPSFMVAVMQVSNTWNESPIPSLGNVLPHFPLSEQGLPHLSDKSEKHVELEIFEKT